MSENKMEVNGAIEQDVLKAANDAVNSWLTDKVRGIQFLQTSNWKIDSAVFLNSTKDRGYLLLLNQDKDKEAELDYVQLLYAAKTDGKWVIYLASLPNLVVQRKKVNNGFIAASLDELSDVGKKEINSRYKNSAGVINDEFVNQEYTADLKKNQADFLAKK